VDSVDYMSDYCDYAASLLNATLIALAGLIGTASCATAGTEISGDCEVSRLEDTIQDPVRLSNSWFCGEVFAAQEDRTTRISIRNDNMFDSNDLADGPYGRMLLPFNKR
jgi:hypothetical protein